MENIDIHMEINKIRIIYQTTNMHFVPFSDKRAHLPSVTKIVHTRKESVKSSIYSTEEKYNKMYRNKMVNKMK